MIAGDGGFQLNLQELQTVARNRLPIKMVIVNNRCHGMVRQFQQSYFEGRSQSTLLGYSAPDFAAVAAAYGIEARRVEDPSARGGRLDDLWRDPAAPFLLEVMVDTFANAYPKLAFGRPITEMEPFAAPRHGRDLGPGPRARTHCHFPGSRIPAPSRGRTIAWPERDSHAGGRLTDDFLECSNPTRDGEQTARLLGGSLFMWFPSLSRARRGSGPRAGVLDQPWRAEDARAPPTDGGLAGTSPAASSSPTSST